MNEYVMTYYRGHDRDDWREKTFKALDLDHALDCATMEPVSYTHLTLPTKA